MLLSHTFLDHNRVAYSSQLQLPLASCGQGPHPCSLMSCAQDETSFTKHNRQRWLSPTTITSSRRLSGPIKSAACTAVKSEKVRGKTSEDLAAEYPTTPSHACGFQWWLPAVSPPPLPPPQAKGRQDQSSQQLVRQNYHSQVHTCKKHVMGNPP